MSMMNVPSLAGGSRTLPAELRTPNIPHGNAWGWHRLHANLTPLTEGGMSGIGDTIPVDPAIRIFPNLASATAHDALNAVVQVQARYSPQAAAAVAAALARIQGQAAPAAITSLQRFLSRSQSGVAGLGYCDDSGTYCDESPYPVVMGTGTYGTGSTIDWGAIIGGVTQDITGLIAVTQGGSVSSSGNIYGSAGTATVAAGFPQNQLNVSGAGVTGSIGTPLLLIGIGLVAMMVLKK